MWVKFEERVEKLKNIQTGTNSSFHCPATFVMMDSFGLTPSTRSSASCAMYLRYYVL